MSYQSTRVSWQALRSESTNWSRGQREQLSRASYYCLLEAARREAAEQAKALSDQQSVRIEQLEGALDDAAQRLDDAVDARCRDTITKAPANDVSRHDQEAVSGHTLSIVVDVPVYSKVSTNILL